MGSNTDHDVTGIIVNPLPKSMFRVKILFTSTYSKGYFPSPVSTPRTSKREDFNKGRLPHKTCRRRQRDTEKPKSKNFRREIRDFCFPFAYRDTKHRTQVYQWLCSSNEFDTHFFGPTKHNGNQTPTCQRENLEKDLQPQGPSLPQSLSTEILSPRRGVGLLLTLFRKIEVSGSKVFGSTRHTLGKVLPSLRTKVHPQTPPFSKSRPGR